MRGNLFGGPDTDNLGSIPAHAGEPSADGHACRGLSPRMRGNPGQRDAGDGPLGSIPAHAGEPVEQREVRFGSIPAHAGEPASAVSRMRRGSIPAHAGEPFAAVSHCATRSRSIPAHAGEPHRSQVAAVDNRVYPRACGGTAAAEANGSIPACGGTIQPAIWSCPSRVYPRACGGTSSGSGVERPRRVYPRACGGTAAEAAARTDGGSIPAHAGEPQRPFRPPSVQGLSPRMRGNLENLARRHPILVGSIPAHAGEPDQDRHPERLGSIPAHAGEPSHTVATQRWPGSIPAHAGEPFLTPEQPLTLVGSIPAHAGEPPASSSASVMDVDRVTGSIPAHAGEPSPFAEFKRVYPRVCGGTMTTRLQESCKLGSIPAHAGEPLVANLLILLVFKEQGDEGHPLTSLQE